MILANDAPKRSASNISQSCSETKGMKTNKRAFPYKGMLQLVDDRSCSESVRAPSELEAKTCDSVVRMRGEDKGDVCFSTGTRSVKIRKHLVILLMSFVALSDHTRRASTVNNGGKCNYSQSNYSL